MSNIQIISLLVFGWMIVTLIVAAAVVGYHWICTGSLSEAIQKVF